MTTFRATITEFPATLNIGDSYTVDAGESIQVFIRNSANTAVTDIGTHSIDDPDFAPTLIITQDGKHSRVKATVTLVDPGVGESYLRVEIPSEQSRRASPGVATMQCVLVWDGVERTLATQAVTWIARV